MPHVRVCSTVFLVTICCIGSPVSSVGQEAVGTSWVGLESPPVAWNQTWLEPSNARGFDFALAVEQFNETERRSLGQNMLIGAVTGFAIGFLAGWAADAALEPELTDLEFAYLYRVTGAGIGIVLGTAGGILYTRRR